MTEEKLRRIRSFVKREGRMTESQKEALQRYWPQYGLTTQMGRLDFLQAFGRCSEVVLEIGFGMGDSLLEMAQNHQVVDYIGVEVHRPGVGALLIQMAKTETSNIRIFQEDVNDVLAKSIADASLSGLQIYFPDPWHKKRHHKRRLIQPGFVELLWQKLKFGGQVHLATDWENYAEQMMEVLSNHDGFNNVVGRGNYVQDQQLRPTTKFEKRGQRLGHGVWDLVFVKMDY